MTTSHRDDAVLVPSSAEPVMPPGWRQPRPAEIGAATDAAVSEARRRSTVLQALPCQRPGCRKTLAWLIVLHEARSEGDLRLELAAPVEDAPVDADDRPGTWVAFTLQGKVQTREAPSRYVGGLGGDGVIRITCRCGQRNWLDPAPLRQLGEALRI